MLNGTLIDLQIGLFLSTAEAVLQKMDDMQKMRRRLRDRDTTEEVITPTVTSFLNFRPYMTLDIETMNCSIFSLSSLAYTLGAE